MYVDKLKIHNKKTLLNKRREISISLFLIENRL